MEREPKNIRPRKGPIVAFPDSTFPDPCNRAPLRHFLPTPKRMHAFDGLLYAEQGTLFGKSPCTTPFGGLPYGGQDQLFQQDAIRRTERTPPTGFHMPSRKVSTARTSFDCPNVRFMQDRCHVRITGRSSFLTFHAGVESVGPLSRDRRPFKRNQLQKEAGFLLLKTGARPKRNSRRDVGLCSCRDVGS